MSSHPGDSAAVPEPPDVDAFWRDTLSDARREPVLLDVRPEPNDLAVLQVLGKRTCDT